MTEKTSVSTGARVLGPHEGEVLGPPDGVRDRFIIGRQDSGGRFALLEHLLAPRALAAPLHLHAQEDEYSYVLEGRVGALLGEEEVFGEVGDLIFKPRGQWHTFWNAGDVPARILEIISPAGLEELFRQLDTLSEPPDVETLTAMADRYRCQADFDRTATIIERHGLAF
jgi:mannose-6-phosphate isomerase-like protein (cupin superfamily)